RSIGSCRGAQPHDGTCSSAVRPYCLRSKTWESLRPHVHLCNNTHQIPKSEFIDRLRFGCRLLTCRRQTHTSAAPAAALAICLRTMPRYQR
ncbi:MAG: hypothetical protein VB125_04700, partial [Burkholderia sp.]